MVVRGWNFESGSGRIGVASLRFRRISGRGGAGTLARPGLRRRDDPSRSGVVMCERGRALWRPKRAGPDRSVRARVAATPRHIENGQSRQDLSIEHDAGMSAGGVPSGKNQTEGCSPPVSSVELAGLEGCENLNDVGRDVHLLHCRLSSCAGAFCLGRRASAKARHPGGLSSGRTRS